MEGADTEGVGSTVIENTFDVPTQPFAVGVMAVMEPVIAAEVAFVAVKEMLPAPLADSPMPVLLFAHV